MCPLHCNRQNWFDFNDVGGVVNHGKPFIGPQPKATERENEALY